MIKKSLSIFLLSVLCIFLSARSETQIFLLDCSGSMFGYGYEMANYGNIFYTAKEAMATHIKDLPDSVKVIVVPFCKHLGNPITGSNTEIAEKALSLNYGGSTSDISLVWEEAQQLKTTGNTGNTIYFLVTDGFDNWGGEDDLDRYADSYSAKAGDDEITYFYLATERMKDSPLAKKFVQLPHLDVTSTFDVNPFLNKTPSESDQAVGTDCSQTNDEEKAKVDKEWNLGITWNWKFWNCGNSFDFWRGLSLLLIILVIGGCVYLLFKYKKKVDIGNMVPSGNGGINGEGRTIRQIVKDKFPRSCVVNAEKIFEKNNVPLSRLYKFIKEANSYDNVPSPSKNLKVDFSGCAYPLGNAMSKEELAAKLKERNWDITPDNIRKLHYEEARELLAQELKTTPKVAGEVIGALDLAIHETADGRYELVPNNLHRFQQLYKHKGLVAQRIMELTGEDYDDSNDD